VLAPVAVFKLRANFCQAQKSRSDVTKSSQFCGSKSNSIVDIQSKQDNKQTELTANETD